MAEDKVSGVRKKFAKGFQAPSFSDNEWPQIESRGLARKKALLKKRPLLYVVTFIPGPAFFIPYTQERIKVARKTIQQAGFSKQNFLLDEKNLLRHNNYSVADKNHIFTR